MPRFANTGWSCLNRSAGWCPALSPRNSTLSFAGSAAKAGAANANAIRESRSRICCSKPEFYPQISQIDAD